MIYYLSFFNKSLLRASAKFRLNLFFLTAAYTFQFQAYKFIYLFLPSKLLKVKSFRFYPNFFFNLVALNYILLSFIYAIFYYVV
jgi:hypothetical protein